MSAAQSHCLIKVAILELPRNVPTQLSLAQKYIYKKPFMFLSSGSWLLFGGATASHTVRGLVPLNKCDIFPLTLAILKFEQLWLTSVKMWEASSYQICPLCGAVYCFLSGFRLKWLWAVFLESCPSWPWPTLYSSFFASFFLKNSFSFLQTPAA